MHMVRLLGHRQYSLTTMYNIDDITLFRPKTTSQDTGTLANSDGPNEMPHNALLHQGLHYLLKLKSFFREIQ